MNKWLPIPILALAGLHSASAFGAEPPATKLGNGTPAFQMERQVIAPGGGRASGDGWRLDGTLALVAAGRATGGAFTLDGGYWTADVAAAGDILFTDGFEDTP